LVIGDGRSQKLFEPAEYTGKASENRPASFFGAVADDQNAWDLASALTIFGSFFCQEKKNALRCYLRGRLHSAKYRGSFKARSASGDGFVVEALSFGQFGI
jgi:hypothetical protein